jgi:Na+-driven multidrug efflux pump
MVATGALRGAEDTLIPSILNLVSIWLVRLTLAATLVGSLGIHGVWIAMAIELSVRGILLLIRQLRSPYLKQKA